MNIKLIITDMDGTLLDDRKNIPSINTKALLEAQKQGILVVFASGRIPQTMKKYVEVIKIKDYSKLIIGSNGGVIYDYQTNSYIYEEVCSYEDTLQAVKILKKQNYDFYLAPLNEEQAYLSSQDIYNNNYFDLNSTDVEQLVIDYNDVPQMRKLVVAKKDLTEQAKIKDIFINSKTLKTEVTGVGFIEVIPKNVSKWHAVEKLIKFLVEERKVNLQPNEIICFGDQMNDYDMIKNCHYGVAMLNGVPEVKKIAQFVTNLSNNEGGVGEFLFKHVLSPK